MRERGRYQIQLMKTRSSSGVGQKVDLEFDLETLRIRDLGEDQQQSSGFVKKPSIYESIKAKSTIGESVDTDTGEVEKISADVQASALKKMLNTIKTTG
jgi:hypothetical protein